MTNRSCGVFIYLSSGIPVFFVVFLLGFCIMLFFFEGKRKDALKNHELMEVDPVI